MSEIPVTRYVQTSDGVHVAYQVWGEGPGDLVIVPGLISNLDFQWEVPSNADFLRRLGSVARVIAFDKRGTGLSDRAPGVPDVDRRMRDLTAVMDVADSERAVIWGSSEGGPMSILFAATYPERVTGLVLYGTYAFPRRDADHPVGRTPAEQEEFTKQLTEGWGDGVGLELFAPSIAGDPTAVEMTSRRQRMSASPAGVRALLEASYQIDVRDALPLVQAPTHVIHLTGDLVVSVELGREVARGIEGAELVEIAGTDHLFGPDNLGDLLIEFVTGDAPVTKPNRSLATVLFTDIVESTDQLQKVGDQQWSETLDVFDGLVVRQVSRCGGTVIKATGDGALAVFDGPTRAIGAASAITEGATSIGLAVRTGLHTGEIVRRGDDVAGLAVHIAGRVADKAAADEIFVSRTTTELAAGSGLQFASRGEHRLKGVEGEVELFAVVRGDEGEPG